MVDLLGGSDRLGQTQNFIMQLPVGLQIGDKDIIIWCMCMIGRAQGRGTGDYHAERFIKAYERAEEANQKQRDQQSYRCAAPASPRKAFLNVPPLFLFT
jgi:hypothetical protein